MKIRIKDTDLSFTEGFIGKLKTSMAKISRQTGGMYFDPIEIEKTDSSTIKIIIGAMYPVVRKNKPFSKEDAIKEMKPVTDKTMEEVKRLSEAEKKTHPQLHVYYDKTESQFAGSGNKYLRVYRFIVVKI